MLNTFPALLDYSLLAPFILRVVAGIIFLDFGILSLKKEPSKLLKVAGIIEIVGGVLLILGLLTQVSALVLAILTFIEAYIEYRDPEILKMDFIFYILLLSITLSLLLSGAGSFAIDLPL
jgi:putative oxidoreductase